MKTAVLTTLIMAFALSAFAGPIYDLQTGVYAELDQVTVTDAVVTGVRYNGMFISEAPNQPYAGTWVYTGSTPAVVTGDLVNVQGLYKEYYGFSEIDVSADPLGYAVKAGVHGFSLYPIEVTVADLAADAEPYEGCYIKVLDGMTVTTAPNTYGEWECESMDTPGAFLKFDDYWYDDTTVMLGDTFSGATGCLAYSFGNFLLEIFEIETAVSTDATTLDQVKSLFR